MQHWAPVDVAIQDCVLEVIIGIALPMRSHFRHLDMKAWLTNEGSRTRQQERRWACIRAGRLTEYSPLRHRHVHEAWRRS